MVAFKQLTKHMLQMKIITIFFLTALCLRFDISYFSVELTCNIASFVDVMFYICLEITAILVLYQKSLFGES